MFQKYIWVWLDFKSRKILIKYIIIFAFKHTVRLSGFRRVAQTVSVAYSFVANLVSSIWRNILRKIIMVPEFPEYNPIYTPCPYIKGSWAKIKKVRILGWKEEIPGKILCMELEFLANTCMYIFTSCPCYI